MAPCATQEETFRKLIVTWRNFWHSLSPRQPTRVEEYFGLATGSCTGPN